MLNDGEKKAIESVKDMFSDVTIKDIDEQSITIYGVAMLDVIRVLTVVEKQQKEIEKLKKYEEGYKLLSYSLDNYISKDKIKAKIEEVENYYKELYKQDNSPNEFLIGQDCLSKLSILQEVKQSLLEKE